MLSTQVMERKRVYGMIRGLDSDSMQKALSYIEFLRMREEEDLDDLRYIEAHKHEPSIPLEQALREIGIA